MKYVGVGVGAIIVDKNGLVLLTQRGPRAKSEKGKWGFPGGAIEKGESISEAIVREIKEELGIDIVPVEQLLAIDHILFDENQYWVAIPYIVRIKKGKPRILEPEKMSDLKWVKVEEIKRFDLTIAAQNLLPQVLKKFRE